MKEVKINEKVLRLERGDVTDQEVDAFVYYAEHSLSLGSGYGTAITMRGGPAIQEELNKVAPIKTCEAVISGAGKMKAKHIIHAVGPRFQEQDEETKLRNTMLAVLKIAEENKIETLAFPTMGAGFYGIALNVSAKVMMETIKAHLNSGQSSLKEVVIYYMDSRELPPFDSQLQKI